MTELLDSPSNPEEMIFLENLGEPTSEDPPEKIYEALGPGEVDFEWEPSTGDEVEDA